MMKIRIGLGLDFHRLVPARRLVLGGVDIAFERGLLGHSDADVLSHAIADALLGAAGRGDLGKHFPDDDPRYENISSLELLARVKLLLDQQHYRIANIDATLVAERPRLAKYFPQMRENIAQALGIGPGQLNLKATRPEGLGALGRSEGIAAQAIALLKRAAK